jgi:WD40 repeat protein
MSLQLENQAPPRKSVDFGLVSSVQFSPRGEFLLTTGEDHTARIWDAGDGHLVRELSAYDTEVWHASFSHDGKTIVTASYDGILRLWDTDVEGTVSRARSLIQRDPPLFTEQERATYNIDN